MMTQKSKTKKNNTNFEFLPKDWEIKDYDSCVSRKRISVKKVKQSDYLNIGKFPIIDQGREFVAGYWNDEKDIYTGILPIIIFGDHTRVLKYIESPFVCGADGTKVIVPDTDTVEPLFFYYALKFIDVPNRGYNRHYSILREQNVIVPPPIEQKKIAHVLKTIENAKEKSENVLKALKELKKSLLKHLFTYGAVPINEVDRIKLKETEIGMVPEEWDVDSINNLYDFTSKPRKIVITNDDEIPFIPMECISEDMVSSKFHMKKVSDISSSTFIFKDDLIIAKITPSFENGKQAILSNLPSDYGYATTEVWA